MYAILNANPKLTRLKTQREVVKKDRMLNQ